MDNLIKSFDEMNIKLKEIIEYFFYGYISYDEYNDYINKIIMELDYLKNEIINTKDNDLDLYIDLINKIIFVIPKNYDEFLVLKNVLEYDEFADILLFEDNDKNVNKYLSFIINERELCKDFFSNLNIITNYNSDELINKYIEKININNKIFIGKILDFFIYFGGFLYTLGQIISAKCNETELKHPIIASILPCIFFIVSLVELSKMYEIKSDIKNAEEKIKILKNN